MVLTFPETGSKIAVSIPKKGTVAAPGLVSIAPGKGVTTIDPVSVCLQGSEYDIVTPKCRVKCSPECVHNGALHFPYVLVIPIPCLWIDWFSDTAQHTETAKIMLLDVVRAESTK